MTALTYLQFHLAFLGLPALLMGTATVRGVALPVGPPAATPRLRVAGRSVDARLPGVLVVVVLAVAYTTPWDRYLVARGAWDYGAGVVLARLFGVPLGEYLFFLVQPVLTALWLYLLPAGPPATAPRADGEGSVADWGREVAPGKRAAGAAGGGLVALGGWLALGLDGGLYLGALLLWAAPVLALQWAFGWPVLWARRRVVALGVAVPTLYLWLADRVALALGVWSLSPALTTGATLPLLGLPVEEAAFFLLTTAFVVQGLVLWLWVVDRWP